MFIQSFVEAYKMKLMHNAIRKMGKQIVIIRNKERVEKMTREKL